MPKPYKNGAHIVGIAVVALLALALLESTFSDNSIFQGEVTTVVEQVPTEYCYNFEKNGTPIQADCK